MVEAEICRGITQVDDHALEYRNFSVLYGFSCLKLEDQALCKMQVRLLHGQACAWLTMSMLPKPSCWTLMDAASIKV